MRNFTFRIVTLVTFLCVVFYSCKKDDSVNNNPSLPDLVSRVSASASGFVTDENDAPVAGATVRMGTANTTTNDYGFFSFDDVQVVKTAATITVSKDGYFKGIRTFEASESRPSFVRIKLLPKTIAGTFDATAGGTVSTAEGMSVEFPPNAIVAETNGNVYTGTVTVYAKWLNPEGDIHETMPGDLRALSADGSMKILITYGMMGVELQGDAGENLQMAPGKTSRLKFPLPSTFAADAPSNIPLWYFDEEKGLWIEEGSASKAGNSYVGEVSHFTFWNCDIPANFVSISGTLVSLNGTPVSNARVKIRDINNQNNFRYGHTNLNGEISGFVPANKSYSLETADINLQCNEEIMQFQSQTSNVQLGTITLNGGDLLFSVISGTIVGCNSMPAAGSSVYCRINGSYQTAIIDSSGRFTLNLMICQPGTQAQFTIVDSAGVHSPTQTFTLNPGNLSLDTITVCNPQSGEFFTYSINGVPANFAEPAYNIIQSISGNDMRVQIIGPVSEGIVVFDRVNIGLNSLQQLYTFGPVNGSTLVPAPNETVRVQITEYGAVGEFISGRFSGRLVTFLAPTGPVLDVQGNFRVRREQ